MTMRVVWAFIYGLGTAATALGTMKGPFELQQWAGLLGIFLLTVYAKYTSSGESGVTAAPPFLSPDRRVWTEEERREAAGLPSKRPEPPPGS